MRLAAGGESAGLCGRDGMGADGHGTIKASVGSVSLPGPAAHPA